MLTVYAAWTHGAREEDIAAIQHALRAPAYAARAAVPARDETLDGSAWELISAKPVSDASDERLLQQTHNSTEKARTSTSRPAFGNRLANRAGAYAGKPLDSQQKKWRSGRDSNPRPPA